MVAVPLPSGQNSQKIDPLKFIGKIGQTYCPYFVVPPAFYYTLLIHDMEFIPKNMNKSISLKILPLLINKIDFFN